MIKHILTAIVSFALGLLVMWALRPDQPGPTPVEAGTETTGRSEEIAQLKEKVALYRKTVETLEQENTRLLHAVQSNAAPDSKDETTLDQASALMDALADEREAETGTESSEPDDSPLVSLLESIEAFSASATNGNVHMMTLDEMPEGLSRLIAQGFESQAKVNTEKKVAELQTMLSLTEDQAAEISKVLQSQPQAVSTFLSSLFSGEEPSEEAMIEFLSAQEQDHDQAMGEILTAEQLARYQDHLETERANWNEASARRNLANLQGVVTDLDEQQKEEVFDYFYEQAEAMPASPMLDSTSIQFGAMRNNDAGPLKEILSPAQFDKYNKGRSTMSHASFSSTIIIEDEVTLP